MAALAVFTSATGSHPFLERRVVLLEPAKIGRSVAQAKPSLSNTIFDCKVLSRNHAMLWYENGKVCLEGYAHCCFLALCTFSALLLENIFCQRLYIIYMTDYADTAVEPLIH